MIRWLLLAVLAFAAAAIAAHYLREEAGYVLISFHHWVVETSLLGFVLALIAGLAALYVGFRLFVGGVRLPARVRQALERRRREKAQVSFEEGLLQLLEGNWKRAEVELVRRAADHHAAHLNYLGAARAAQRLGAGDRRDHYLRLATEHSPERAFATLLTQAELQRERGEYALARDTALSLRGLEPRHPYAVELLAEAYQALGAWEPLRVLLQDAELRALLPAARAHDWYVQALGKRLREAQGEARLDHFKALWTAAPREFRGVPLLRRVYAQGLARLNAQAEALALVAETLNREWDGELATLYGELHAEDPLAQLAAIEGWLNKYGERPELLITAGRACLRNKLWGKARSYLEAVVRVAPTPAAYLALAQLCEQTQNPAEAQKFYRQGAELAASS
jgi:HemY protein